MLSWLQSLTPPETVSGAQLIAYVLGDILLIVLLARLLGGLAVRVRQPRVVGEILAGILLGPTVLGANLSQVVAPEPARAVLGVIATLALVLFMFLAGVEYDAAGVRGRAGQATVLGTLSVFVPALLAFPVAGVMFARGYAAPGSSSALPLALMIGAALAVTAFPVMAHLLMERGALNTPIGALGVAAAGVTSVLMFLYAGLAGAVATAGGYGDLLLSIVWTVLFVLGAWFVARPLLARRLPPTLRSGGPSGDTLTGDGMALVFGGMVLFGLIAHVIGINALVGGFAWGFVLPSDARLRRAIAVRIADLSMVLLLPIFFAMSGFATDLRLLSADSLPIILLILAAAVGGKFLAVAPARAFGLSWRDVGTLGALFNMRGLLVLVVGLQGRQLGIITDQTFAVIVIVALVTNIMTLPLLDRLARRRESTVSA